MSIFWWAYVDKYIKKKINQDQLDELILLDIYGAREKEIEGVSSKVLFNKCTNPKKELSSLDSVVEKIVDKEIDVLLTLGAGDISTIIEPLRLRLLWKGYSIL